MKKLFILLIALFLPVAGGLTPVAADSLKNSLLKKIKNRQGANRIIKCGVRGPLILGISTIDTDRIIPGGMEGDLCKAVAAAVLDDEDAVELVPLTGSARFAAIRNGDVDLNFRVTNPSAGRDGILGQGVDFGAPWFHDGQTVMSRLWTFVPDTAPKTLGELVTFFTTGGGIAEQICVPTGSSIGPNLVSLGIPSERLEFVDDLRGSYQDGETCNAVSNLGSLLPTFGSDPVAPVLVTHLPFVTTTREDDSVWATAVSYVVYATQLAAKHDVKQADVNSVIVDPNAPGEIKQLFGLVPNSSSGLTSGEQLGLDPDYGVRIIRAVGNYNEIFERNITAALGFNQDTFANGFNQIFLDVNNNPTGGLMVPYLASPF
jgi:general L-amino acid transport system substrate-binding protein